MLAELGPTSATARRRPARSPSSPARSSRRSRPTASSSRTSGQNAYRLLRPLRLQRGERSALLRASARPGRRHHPRRPVHRARGVRPDDRLDRAVVVADDRLIRSNANVSPNEDAVINTIAPGGEGAQALVLGRQRRVGRRGGRDLARREGRRGHRRLREQRAAHLPRPHRPDDGARAEARPVRRENPDVVEPCVCATSRSGKYENLSFAPDGRHLAYTAATGSTSSTCPTSRAAAARSRRTRKRGSRAAGTRTGAPPTSSPRRPTSRRRRPDRAEPSRAGR